jgi:hypothetical protein
MLRFVYWMYIILFLFVSVLNTGASGNNKAVDASSVIQVEDNLLTVKAGDIPLRKVLMEIANQTPIKIVTAVPVEENIGTEFSHFPIVKGLKRLLRGYNYVFIYDTADSKSGGQKIKKVIITSKEGESLHRRMEPAIAYTEEPPIKYPSEDLYEEDIMISKADAQGSIGSEIAIEHLRDALNNENAGVRLSAVGALGVIGGDMAIQAIEGALVDEDKVVRMLATAELNRLRGGIN